MNVGSTYTLALCVIILLVGISWLVSATREDKLNLRWIYCYFSFGVVFAGCVCVQGALLNPVGLIGVNALFYIIGVAMYMGCLIECVYSLRNGIENIFKLRIFIKASLLSLGHFSPISVVFISVYVDIWFIMIEYTQHKQSVLQSLRVRHSKLWAIR